MSKNNIMHLLYTNKYSGQENVVVQMINVCKEKYCCYYVSKNGDELAKILDRNGVSFKPVDSFNFFEMKRLIKELKPDIIHAHDVRASIYAAIYAPKGVKVISSIASNFPEMKKASIKSLLYFSVSHRFSHIFWVTEDAMNEFKFSRKVSKKSSVLENIIEKESVLKLADQALNDKSYDIVYCGRLGYQKNPVRFLEICKQIATTYPNLKVAMIGDGVLKNDVTHMINELQLNDIVEMFGFMENPYPIIKNARIFCMTSRFEGTPMVALDAMALGKPIISTPTDGLNKIVVNGKNGFLKDTNQGIVQAIVALLNDEKQLLEMGKASQLYFDEINNAEKFKNELFKYYDAQ